MIQPIVKRVAVLVVMLALVLPGFARAEETYMGHPVSAATMLVDFVALRPLGIAATLLGTAVFVVSLPFSAIAGNVGEAADRLVADPFRYTFERPLGHAQYSAPRRTD